MATHSHAADPTSTTRRPHWRHASDAQVMLLFAMAFVALIGVVALSIDAGYLLAERRQVQNAADAAALAAARSALDNQPYSSIAQSYGKSNAGTAAQVVTNRPPISGAYAGNNNYIQVTITKPVTKFFVGAVYNGDWSVSATAVAGLEPRKFDAALLALNPDAGGISTGGSTTIEVAGGSIVSNYRISTSGSTRMVSDKLVVANDGIVESGSSVVKGDLGRMDHGPEVPDPLKDKISPPALPNFPGNSVPTASGASVGCRNYSPWDNPVTYTGTPGQYSGNSRCVGVANIPGGQTFTFPTGDYTFQSGAGINIGGGNGGQIVLGGGTWNFDGNGGITVGGSTPNFEMRYGRYSFTNGAKIDIGGSANNNVIGSGGGSTYTNSIFYFSGGGGINTGGSNKVTLYPGTYIFDGGPGLWMHGSDQLIFKSGTYKFYFRNGASLKFSGSSRIVSDAGTHVEMYFYGGARSWSDLDMSGSTSFNIPAGEYYFDHGRFLNSGSTVIAGQNVFLYFKNDGYLESTGSASFSFTAPETVVYPGYYPGVFMYSDARNSATFEWHGSTASVSKGTVYLPSSPLKFGGASYGKQIEGQVIVDRLITGGSTMMGIDYVEYVETSAPAVYLTE